MNCPRCGQPVEANAAFCSSCGLKIEQSTRPLDAASAEPEASPAVRAGNKQGCRTALMVAGIALLVVLVIGGLGAGAVYLGMRDREVTQTDEAESYYQQGETYFSQGQYELAIAAYDQALQLNPAYQEAANRRAEAQALLNVVPTDTPVLQQETMESLWQAHQERVEQSDWEGVVETAEGIIARDPNYRRAELDANLYAAYMGLANQAVDDERMEEALRDLERALALVPNSTEATNLQSLVTLYVDGIRFFGADWASAIERFSTLYAAAPGFADARQRLVTAYTSYGEQLASDGSWCEAAAQYTEALALGADSALDALLQDANAQCALVDLDQDGTPDVTVEAPSGTYAGRELQAEAVGADKMFVRGHVYDSSGDPVVGTRVKIQAWDFSVYATTDGSGQFSFDGLANAVVFTLTLADLPSVPLEVETAWGRLSWVEFVQAP